MTNPKYITARTSTSSNRKCSSSMAPWAPAPALHGREPFDRLRTGVHATPTKPANTLSGT